MNDLPHSNSKTKVAVSGSLSIWVSSLRLYKVIQGYTRLYKVIQGNIRLYKVIHGYTRSQHRAARAAKHISYLSDVDFSSLLGLYFALRWDALGHAVLLWERDNKEELWWCYCCKERAKTYLNSPGIPCHTTHNRISSCFSFFTPWNHRPCHSLMDVYET